MPAKAPGQWIPAGATRRINACAAGHPTLSYTGHAREQMLVRELLIGDVLHVLRRGFVYDAPVASTRDGFFKYRIEATTPNSDGRTVAVVVIPNGALDLKLVTVMWRDER